MEQERGMGKREGIIRRGKNEEGEKEGRLKGGGDRSR